RQSQRRTAGILLGHDGILLSNAAERAAGHCLRATTRHCPTGEGQLSELARANADQHACFAAESAVPFWAVQLGRAEVLAGHSACVGDVAVGGGYFGRTAPE